MTTQPASQPPPNDNERNAAASPQGERRAPAVLKIGPLEISGTQITLLMVLGGIVAGWFITNTYLIPNRILIIDPTKALVEECLEARKKPEIAIKNSASNSGTEKQPTDPLVAVEPLEELEVCAKATEEEALAFRWRIPGLEDGAVGKATSPLDGRACFHYVAPEKEGAIVLVRLKKQSSITNEMVDLTDVVLVVRSAQ